MILVCLGTHPYEKTWQLGLVEAYGRRTWVVYIDPDPSYATRGSLAAFSRSLEVLGRSGQPGKGILKVPMPALIPGNRLRQVAILNRWLGVRAVLRALRRKTRSEVVLVSQRPDLLPTFRGLRANLRVYEVVDDYVGLTDGAAMASRVARAHRRLIRESDVVWATSLELIHDLRKYRQDVYETTNGVEFEAFANPDFDLKPARMDVIPRPRIGLVGKLNDRIDWRLIEQTCRQSPNWHFVFVGPLHGAGERTKTSLLRLEKVSNFHHLPEVGRPSLPATIGCLDVGLVPYRLGHGTLGINPLKVYQYLAGGIPVVATPLPQLSRLKDVVFFGEDVQPFTAAISQALAVADSGEARHARQRLAKCFDWNVIADNRLEILRARLGH